MHAATATLPTKTVLCEGNQTPSVPTSATTNRITPVSAFEKACDKHASLTRGNARDLGVWQVAPPQREVHLMVNGAGFYGHVSMGVGAKIVLAEEMRKHNGRTHYDAIAHDCVVDLTNEIVASGVMPTAVAMHLAVDGERWYEDRKRSSDLIRGWFKGCEESRCVWASRSLSYEHGVFLPGMSSLSGSLSGVARRNHLLDPANIMPKDLIIMVESPTVSSGGLILAKRALSHLSDGYATELPDGKMYGETLLEPKKSYVGLIKDLLETGVHVRTCVNLSGEGGWRKIMKAEQPLSYKIDRLPPIQAIHWFIQEHGLLSDEECYAHMNMGAGFVIFIRPQDLVAFKEVMKKHEGEHSAFLAGHVEASDQVSKLYIKPKDLVYEK